MANIKIERSPCHRRVFAISNRWTAALALLASFTCHDASAQASILAIPGHDPQMMLAAIAPAAPKLTVSSPSFAPDGDIPLVDTQYGDNRFPGLSWSSGPAGTQSYAVIVQGELGADPSLGTSIHLVLYDLPATILTLPVGMTERPAESAYGPNVHGPDAAYAGPHTHDASPHAYHFQVFALDTALTFATKPDFATIKGAIREHVLAAGELVGYASKPATAQEHEDPSPVRIETGLLAGVAGRDPTTVVYKGIPYAAPPVGPLRWRPPERPIAWGGVRKADHFGPACPQPTGDNLSEDCLTLNIWTSAKPVGHNKRPVFVWFYGGGFIAGNGAQPEFDGEALARKDVVVVTLNYRIGVLGFLATPELSQESGHRASGNFGLLDDITALQWVQRNISAFGGDSSKVTIGGQSAGAGTVGFLSMSPLAKGLFRASIAESHARYPQDPELRYLSVSWRPLDSAEKAGAAYVETHGGRTLVQLRAMPWQTLIDGSNTVDTRVETGSSSKPPLFRPVIDGWVIPHDYSQTYKAHAQNKVTFVAGNNKDEGGAVPESAFDDLRKRKMPMGGMAGMPQTSLLLSDYRSAAHRKFGALADEFLRLYPAHDDEEAALQNNAAARDNSRISTWLWGTLWTQGDDKPVYTYFWTHAPPGTSRIARGAYHGSEIFYTFDSLDALSLPWTDEDRRIADTMSSYWANIIKSGDPNGDGLPSWPRYDPKKPLVMELGDHFGAIPVASDDKISFWKRFFATQPAW